MAGARADDSRPGARQDHWAPGAPLGGPRGASCPACRAWPAGVGERVHEAVRPGLPAVRDGAARRKTPGQWRASSPNANNANNAWNVNFNNGNSNNNNRNNNNAVRLVRGGE